ncbi:MAG: redox-regulated ATPase YchF [Bacteroidota bacterium]
MQIGIVGLPFSGKSTLFQAATKTRPDPFTPGKPEARHAIVKVPDDRLEKLSAIFSPKSTTHAIIEFLDVAGLQKGESDSAQFTTEFLTKVRNNDALVQVVRSFEDDAVPHPEGNVDSHRDIASFETEFILSDLMILETRMERIRKQLQKTRVEDLHKELSLLEKCRAILENEKPLREAEFEHEEARILRTYQLLSLKPMLIALNLNEPGREGMADHVETVAGSWQRKRTKVLSFFGKIDSEIAELPEGEAKSFMEEFGLKESALDTLIRESYALLGLQSFFTVGEDECRAWTIRRGMTAQEAAGVIHSDLSTRFIRAEVVHYDDFMAHGGSFAKAREAGKWRLEGKDYIVKDGDIMSIRNG